jgi:hypothetical protein
MRGQGELLGLGKLVGRANSWAGEGALAARTEERILARTLCPADEYAYSADEKGHPRDAHRHADHGHPR